MLLVAVLINSEGEGPIIHRRICIGENGRQFIMYKFRSMVFDADNLERYLTHEQIEQYKKEFKLDNDPRVTKIGRFIRKTSIDELPQLFSIIKGDMSLVGPRPLVERELSYYGPQSVSILSIKPGLTGYWQVNGRSESTYESGKRQELELFYVTHCTLLLDIKIILQTIKVVLGGVGAK
jgi:lipopolysaccharide/colanic/teichoic acid biosynthesis glycosyltransferase